MINKKYLKSMNEKDAEKLKEQVLGRISPGADIRECPHCGSADIIKWGFNGKIQKYHCKECMSYFSATTNTIFSSSSSGYEVWSDFLDCEFRGMPLKDEADLISRSRTTCFHMRRKFYKIAEQLIGADA